MEWSIDSDSEQRTRQVGEALGRLLGAGDVLLLDGELGAGKTCLIQGLALGLGVPPERRVNSPSFALVHEHPGRVPLFHIDLYRIEQARELDELGLSDYLEGQGVAAVEWAERLAGQAPSDALSLRIDKLGDSARRLTLRSTGPRSAERLAQLKIAL